ncbi:MAG: LppM family (lipo)protein, partial [Thermomicrobiales bacterium]
MALKAIAQRARRGWLWRRVVPMSLLVVMALLLSACIEVNQQSTIKTDFTGTSQIRLGISKQALLLLGGFASSFGTPSAGTTPTAQQDPFASLNAQIKQLGGTSKPYSNDKFQGVDASFTFKSLEEMQTQINTVLGSSSALNQTTGATSTTPTGTQSDIVTITAKATANGVRIDGTVDPLSTLNDPTSATTIPGLDPKSFGAADGVVNLSFNMPGKILTKDPLAKQDKSTVSWNFKAGDKKATIFVESDKSGSQGGNVVGGTTSSSSSGNKTLLIGLIVALVVLAGGAGLFFAMRGRRAKPAAYPAGQYPPQGTAPYGQPPYGGPQQPPGGYGQPQPPQGQPPQQPYGG